ncbi:type IV secretion protein Rhs [Pluralibacter gergoviae]|uniref:type IV secretion protein Rhs n=1 Tax=Pluralibacter gergoviae TaxID=61647 RepID=UPI000907F3A8|nr:type IV secretion protein Rhs [Pluralibacter gergoviae]EKV0932557.1 type IV secretion protein Rhs [Pluralibacter gergoviae]EKV6249270.1 type IV secretion protein Rhs [Pluralibacter gergoviae]EKZ9517564.1 type IV secretion protein Rhs [Pluralibacter gergoviae]ELC3019665.1 type IV secretion protein Rhs [Pluralibacter gergoviae]ELC3024623.1 type IV secretion protein Rhs [Pluralibacter gergoviae]
MPVNKRITPSSGTPIAPGGLRLLTLGEIALAQTLYGGSIIYSRVWIHRESYLPFNLQPIDIAMSPNGEMWYREDTYSPDFSADILVKKHRFMHEMMHIWQSQKGMFVRTRGMFSRFTDYSYSLNKTALLRYGLEQQASIVSDYWLLIHYGFAGNSNIHTYRDYTPTEPVRSLIAKYRAVLRGFPG